ncbi:MAG: AAA family ATPase [Labilithrix sp.]|nr:AAA family ATPase [Labilithrix sp.]
MPSSYEAFFSLDPAFRARLEGAFADAVFGVDRAAPPPGPHVPAVTWDDICGQAKAKAALREAIEMPIRHADVYRRYGRKPTKGVLLHGPPGNGKTLLAKASASAVVALHAGRGSGGGARSFVHVNGPELLDKFVGETERKIRELFFEARRHQRDRGYPSILFVDEAEALLPARGGKMAWLAGTIVPMFLAEMDGVQGGGGPIVILATNRPDDLDPAVVRDGRIDRKVHVGPPDRDGALEVLVRALRGKPLAAGGSVDEFSSAAAAELFDARHGLYRLHLDEGPPKTVAIRDLVSCAQVVGIVERATSRAIEREIATGEVGIRAADLVEEVSSTVDESRAVFHAAELDALVATLRVKVREIERIKPAPTPREAS